METPNNTFSPVQLVECGNHHMCGNLARPYLGKPKSYCNECRADHLLSLARESIDQLGLGDDELPFQARLDQAEKAIIDASNALAQAKVAGGSLREAFAAFLGPIAEIRELLDQAAQSQCQQLLERAEEIYISSGVFEYMDRWAQVKLLQVLRTLGPERYPSFQRVTWLTYEEEDQVLHGRPLRYEEVARVLPNLERNCNWARKHAEQDFEEALAQAAEPAKTASRSSGRKREKSLRDQQIRLQMRGSSGGGKKR